MFLRMLINLLYILRNVICKISVISIVRKPGEVPMRCQCIYCSFLKGKLCPMFIIIIFLYEVVTSVTNLQYHWSTASFQRRSGGGQPPSPHRPIFRMDQRVTANVTHAYMCLPIIQVSLACKISRYLCLTSVVVTSLLTYLHE